MPAEVPEEIRKLAYLARSTFIDQGFPVHKEEQGDEVRALGHQVGGHPAAVTPAEEKRWLAIECMWELAQRARGRASDVESNLGLAAWLFMVSRSGLSIFDKSYGWVRQHRHERHVLDIPVAVRCELVAAAEGGTHRIDTSKLSPRAWP